ncbi:MAG: type VI secretion system baseplate subunit TssK, partial [Gemmataceae bacterium]
VFKKNFRGEGLMMTVEMNPEWLADKWSFYIGVQSNLPQATVIALLTAAQMNMKIASANRVEEVYTRGLAGMQFQLEQQPPRVLVQSPKDTYFVLNKNPEEWPFLQQSRRVAIRLNERALQGSIDRKEEIFLKGSGNAASPMMRFTLYIVPPK